MSGNPEDEEVKYENIKVEDNTALFTVNVENGEIGISLPPNLDIDKVSLMYFGLCKLLHGHKQYIEFNFGFSKDALQEIENKARKGIDVIYQHATKTVH